MFNKINYIYKKHNNTNKETVLFLHGWGGSVNSFLFFQDNLSPAFSTLNIDFMGFGNSTEPTVAFDTFLYALSIYELLVSLNIETVYIVSHSFGGRVAILLSTIFNINVKKLVLIASAGLKPKRGAGYYFKIYLFKMLKKLSKTKLFPKKLLNKFGSSDYKQLSNIMKLSFIKIINNNLIEFVPKITAKTLIVWGSADKSTSVSFAHTFKKLIKQNKLVIYKNSGHFCYLENKINFYYLLNNFLLEP